MRIFLILLITCFIGNLQAQETAYVPNEFLIQLAPKQKVADLMYKLSFYHQDVTWETPQQLVPDMQLWHLRYQGPVAQSKILAFLEGLEQVQIVQYNHKVTLRSPQTNYATTPNDPNFNNQWQYINNGVGAGIDLDAELAWDVTTGGLTANNDTIVVAVIDNGISNTQTDFGDNIWVNWGEIPNNGIDDDNNGYIDDYRGWNSTLNNDNIIGGTHGTSVAGIVGAKGNNNNGVTGVNWNVKMMIIRNDWNVTEANVLNAYGYALKQRRLYNQTNGAEGAFVVATNASWGQNNGQPANAPLWCAFYDTLGAAGIINIAATANANTDVDLMGDLPTACPSDYLLAVTNINRLGNKVTQAAYGQTAIDLGAFGEGVFTLRGPSGTGTFGGTSGAAPHVAGTIGLLYAGACQNFMDYTLAYPDSAALKMKAYIMNGVVPTTDLMGTTVSEGYLNMNNSMTACINDCPTNTCFAPYQVGVTTLQDTLVTIAWQFTSSVNQVQYRLRTQGGTWSGYTLLGTNQQQVILNPLLACTNYEIELQAVCGAILGRTISFSFKTEGCCEALTGLNATNLNIDSVQLTWNSLFSAQNYSLRYREVGTNAWQQVVGINNPNYWLTQLDSCTAYEWNVKATCTSGQVAPYSDTNTFITLGCISCAVLNYCAANGANSVDDWIDTFGVDYFKHGSGNNGGYLFYDSVPILLGKGDYHRVQISQGKAFSQKVKVWLDINQDGDFDDFGEELLSDEIAVNDTTLISSFIVPPTTLLGVTRLRVGLRWNSFPDPCGTVPFGEYEDYCAQVIEGNSIERLPDVISNVTVYPNPFSDQITIDFTLTSSTQLGLRLHNSLGQVVWEQAPQFVANGVQQLIVEPRALSAGLYWLEIQTEEGQIWQQIVKQP